MQIKLFNPDSTLWFAKDVYLDTDTLDPVVIYENETDTIVGLISLAYGQVLRIE